MSFTRTAVLLVHGIVSTPKHFAFFLPCIPKEWTVVNLLLDGHGGSVRDFSKTSMKKWKRQVRTHLEQLCETHGTVYIVGYSMGTLLTMEFADNHPQVRGLFLLNPPLKVRVKPVMVKRMLKFSFGMCDTNDPEELATRRDIGVKLTPCLWLYLGWIPNFLALLRLCRACRPVAATLSIPCHVFLSGRDELVSLKSAAYFEGNPHVRVHVFERSCHCFYEDAFTECVKECFLNRI